MSSDTSHVLSSLNAWSVRSMSLRIYMLAVPSNKKRDPNIRLVKIAFVKTHAPLTKMLTVVRRIHDIPGSKR